MDIAHDRAGYYLCWGCLVWVPSIYTSPALYLVKQPVNLHPLIATAFFVAGACFDCVATQMIHGARVIGIGVACIYINYDADRQRQEFRATNGAAKVWGAPPKIIKAQYVTGAGETKTSLLLASGTRHKVHVYRGCSMHLW